MIINILSKCMASVKGHRALWWRRRAERALDSPWSLDASLRLDRALADMEAADHDGR